MATEDRAKTIRQRVSKSYWEQDRNCATTALSVLSEIFGIELHSQTIDSALAMHGAGKYGAQCGLVEGALMFMGIWGRVIQFLIFGRSGNINNTICILNNCRTQG